MWISDQAKNRDLRAHVDIRPSTPYLIRCLLETVACWGRQRNVASAKAEMIERREKLGPIGYGPGRNDCRSVGISWTTAVAVTERDRVDEVDERLFALGGLLRRGGGQETTGREKITKKAINGDETKTMCKARDSQLPRRYREGYGGRARQSVGRSIRYLKFLEEESGLSAPVHELRVSRIQPVLPPSSF